MELARARIIRYSRVVSLINRPNRSPALHAPQGAWFKFYAALVESYAF